MQPVAILLNMFICKIPSRIVLCNLQMGRGLQHSWRPLCAAYRASHLRLKSDRTDSIQKHKSIGALELEHLLE